MERFINDSQIHKYMKSAPRTEEELNRFLTFLQTSPEERERMRREDTEKNRNDYAEGWNLESNSMVKQELYAWAAKFMRVESGTNW